MGLIYLFPLVSDGPKQLVSVSCINWQSCFGVVLTSIISSYFRWMLKFLCYKSLSFLQIFDKLCQSFNGDVLQTLFNSAEGLASSPPEKLSFWVWRFSCDQGLAVAASNILPLSLIICSLSCGLFHRAT